MHWRLSWRADPAGARIMDNHYSRQTPGADQFVPPGRCVVLVIHEAAQQDVALWTTSWPYPQYVKHAWPGAWVCSAFRNQWRDEDGRARLQSSSLIVEAISATRWFWEPPREGMITFVNQEMVRHKRDPGRCFRRAGFHIAGKATSPCSCTPGPSAAKDGKLALHLSQFPPPLQPIGAQSALWGCA